MKAGFLFGGLVFVVCAAAMAVGAVLVDDTGARITLGILAVAFLATSTVFFWVAGKVGSIANLEALRENGILGQGTILKLRETGITVNETNAVLAFTVMVQHAGQAPYPVKFEQLVPRLAMGVIAPGRVVAVRVDPQNPDEVAIDFEAPVPASGGGGMEQTIDIKPGELEQTITHFPGMPVHLVEPKLGSAAAILAGGSPGKATVINTFPTDTTLPDGDSVVGYILNVQPADGRPPYQVEIGHRTPRTLTHQPAPGAELAVKISPTDQGEVAIDWVASGFT